MTELETTNLIRSANGLPPLKRFAGVLHYTFRKRRYRTPFVTHATSQREAREEQLRGRDSYSNVIIKFSKP